MLGGHTDKLDFGRQDKIWRDKHHKSYLKRKFMLPEVSNNYQRGAIASKMRRKTITLVEIKSLIDFYRPFIDLIDQIFDKSLYID